MGENPTLSPQLSIGLSGRCSLDSTPSFALFCRTQLVIAPRFEQPGTREGLYLVLCGPTTQCWNPTQARIPNPTVPTPSPSGVSASGSEGGRDVPVMRFLYTIVANITVLYIRISAGDFEHSETQPCIGGTSPRWKQRSRVGSPSAWYTQGERYPRESRAVVLSFWTRISMPRGIER